MAEFNEDIALVHDTNKARIHESKVSHLQRQVKDKDNLVSFIKDWLKSNMSDELVHPEVRQDSYELFEKILEKEEIIS